MNRVTSYADKLSASKFQSNGRGQSRPVANSVRLMARAGLGALTIGALAFPGNAQEVSDRTEDAALSLDEIVVTARKRPENLQDTPISMTVFSAEQMERPGLDDITDVARFAPNVVIDQGTGNTGSSNNSQAFIRGVGQTDFLFSSDPGVGIYIDDVYLPRVTGSILDLIDVERVEVLRGPQGTLFGKNTIGGAISVVSKAPEDMFAGYASLDIGSRSRIDGKVSASIPLIEDSLSLRVSVASRNQDGYVKRTEQNGRATGDVDSKAIRGQLRWTPAESWRVLLTGDYTQGREEAIAGELIQVDTDAALVGLWNALVAPGVGSGEIYDSSFVSPERESRATGPSFSDIDAWGVSLNVSGPISDSLDFKSITAVRETDSSFGMDQDHSPLRFAESTNDNEHKQFSQEFQLIGEELDGRLNWVGGAFYMHEEGSDVYNLTLAGGLFDAVSALPAPVLPLVPGITCPPSPGVVLPCAGGAGNPANIALDFDVSIFNEIEIDSYALYGQASYELTDKLSVTGGGRYSIDEKEITTTLQRNGSGVVSIPRTTIANDWDAFTPRLSVDYKWRPGLMTYASVSRGFKSGGFNGRAASIGEVDSFDPETIWAYELGAKAELFNRRLIINSAIFHNDYEDIQLTSVRSINGVLAVVTENAGQAEFQGVELEFVGRPKAGLSIRGGIGYLDAKYTQLAPGATVSLDSQPVKTPEWTANLAADQEIGLGNFGAVVLSGDLTYRSSHFNESTNFEALRQDGFVLLGANATYISPNERWSLSFYGRNLGDERYITNGVNALDSVGTVDATFGRPREWGAVLKTSF